MRQALKFMAALVVCAVVLTPAASSLGATSTHQAYKPRLLTNFFFRPENNGQAKNGAVGYRVQLDLDSTIRYRGVTPSGGVPWVKLAVTVVTPGATIDRSRSRFGLGAFASHYPAVPKSNLTYRVLPGTPYRAVWLFRNLHAYPKPSWTFWVKVPQGQPRVCVKATATFSVPAPWQSLPLTCLPQAE